MAAEGADAAQPALATSTAGIAPSFNGMYDDIDRSTARDLREVATMIYGVKNGVPDVHARFFQLNNGGYDTHSDGRRTTSTWDSSRNAIELPRAADPPRRGEDG
jgi:hypothetical protein